MSNHIHHRGYAGEIVYSAEDACLIGHVIGVSSTIGYHGSSVEEITQAFRDAVDVYIDSCAADGVDPERPTRPEQRSA